MELPKFPAILLLLFVLITGVAPFLPPFEFDGSCPDECMPNTILECDHGYLSKSCTNCCRLQGTSCALIFLNGTNACRSSRFTSCPESCLPALGYKCRDPLYLSRCENCYPGCSIFFPPGSP